MQNPTKNNVRTFVRSLYNARLLEQTEAESVALESHYISLEADGRVDAAEAFHLVRGMYRNLSGNNLNVKRLLRSDLQRLIPGRLEHAKLYSSS